MFLIQLTNIYSDHIVLSAGDARMNKTDMVILPISQNLMERQVWSKEKEIFSESQGISFFQEKQKGVQ